MVPRASTFAQVYDYPPDDLSSTAWLVLLALAWYAKEDKGRFCFADNAKLWARAKVSSQRTYERALGELRKAGAIIAYKAERNGIANIYWVNTSEGYAREHPTVNARLHAPATYHHKGMTYYRCDEANDSASQKKAS